MDRILNLDKYREKGGSFSLNYLLADRLVSSDYGLLLAPAVNPVSGRYGSRNHTVYQGYKSISRCTGNMSEVEYEWI